MVKFLFVSDPLFHSDLVDPIYFFRLRVDDFKILLFVSAGSYYFKVHSEKAIQLLQKLLRILPDNYELHNGY